MSRTALSIFVEKILPNATICPKVVEDKYSEDWTTSLCWANLDVYAVDGRDVMKKERFLCFPLEAHLFPWMMPEWYSRRLYYPNRDGFDCCSNYTISFHYIGPRTFYTLYFLMHHLQPYGIEYRHPPLPRKPKLDELVATLEMERTNSSSRI